MKYLNRMKKDLNTSSNVYVKCHLRDIIKVIVSKKVCSVDIHIALMNYEKNDLNELCRLYYEKGVAKIIFLVTGARYYQENYGFRHYESAYQNFFICFDKLKLV